MVLAASLLVRDEEDIVLQNIEHHLEQGVDFFIATDNGSVDNTLNILQSHPAIKQIILEPEHNYHQAKWVNRMAQILFDWKVDWIVHLDADEFWYGFDFLEEVPPDILVVKSGTHIEESQCSGATCREHVPLLYTEYHYPFVRESLPYYKHSIQRHNKGSKIVHRPDRELQVTQGNHKAWNIPIDKQIYSTRIHMDHYPIRSYEHFKKKVINGGSSYIRSGLHEGLGYHWREWYQLYLTDKLEDEYRHLAYSKEQAAEALAKGELYL